MRKLSFIMILLFCATFTYAQKGKVTQAISYLTSGKLDQAKKLIDEAMGHESCVAWDKAYLKARFIRPYMKVLLQITKN
jgi:Tfp pilus assembly protein PilF